MNSQERLDELRLRVRTNTKTLRLQYCQTRLFQSLSRKAKNNEIATEQDYEQIQSILTGKDAELLHRFYMLLPNPSETELHAFLLLHFGMSKTEAGLLTAHSQSAITNICTRLFHKVHGRKCSTSNEAYEWLLQL